MTGSGMKYSLFCFSTSCGSLSAVWLHEGPAINSRTTGMQCLSLRGYFRTDEMQSGIAALYCALRRMLCADRLVWAEISFQT